MVKDIEISWQYPDDNSDTILSYKITLRAHDGVTFIESPFCDGSLSEIVDKM